MAYNANKTKLFCNDVELDHLMEVPELGGEAEKIDVTTLSSPHKEYIRGMREYGDLAFKFLYDNSGETANFRVLKTLDDADEAADFRIEYPDGTAHKFSAVPAVKLDSGAINGALTFTATMMLTTKIATVNPGAADEDENGVDTYE